MRQIFGVFLLLLTIFLTFLLDKGSFGMKPLGKMLSPTHGVWQSAVNVNRQPERHLVVSTSGGDVDVYFDERGVPHVFAPNEEALYYAQGYIQARDRLWQMDFQVRLADGRLSEIVGEAGLNYDRFFRRIGIPDVARRTIEQLKDDPGYQTIVQSYTDGVNAWINGLSPNEYPLEYKLTDSAPEAWSPVKCVLLLKMMALQLSGFDTDVANTNTLRVLGEETFRFLFPDFPRDQSPIIPVETVFPFTAPDLASLLQPEGELSAGRLPDPIPHHKGIGSNNWAVSSAKTASGGAILCNDPHLGLSYPSIWYEMQLHTADMNVYGVTIPGAPCIIIGFNEHIAWGVTNGSRDVRDWYSVQYKDATQSEYLFDSTYVPVDRRIEVIHVKGGDDVIDTVQWTTVGPVVYDDSYGRLQSTKGLAMQWLALEVSNELQTFYDLNKARDHAGYLAALNHYRNPAQNFAYADREGNVAIKEQGRFKVMDDRRGQFVEPLAAQTAERLYTYIPTEHNPYVLNPPRGFISSANQHPTNETYPYKYGGWFERYRNRHINQLLESADSFTVEDMMVMQNDNYNLMAAEMLPTMLELLDHESLDARSRSVVRKLREWNYFNEYSDKAPSYFQEWFEQVKRALWDELADTAANYRIPLDYETFLFLTDQPEHPLIDNQNTAAVETVAELVNQGFTDMMAYFENQPHAEWQYYNALSVEHLLSLPAFSDYHIPVGGSENAINANVGNHGPSWRMIVSLNEDGVEAYGVYPGGPSGNPGDPAYKSFLEEWAKGQYFKLNFYPSIEAAQKANSQP